VILTASHFRRHTRAFRNAISLQGWHGAIRANRGTDMKKSKLNIKDLKKNTAIVPLPGEQMRLIIGGQMSQGGTTSDTADTDQ
jgi:hypothetical protein